MEKVMAIVNGETVIDYAYPCMMAEKALKNLHNLMLEGKYEAAMDAAMEAMADVKLTLNAIKDMQERVAK
jgi:hypothetical protein